MALNTNDRNNIKLDDDKLDKDDPDIIIHARRMAWCNGYKKGKACKKDISKELLPSLWHPTRWQDL